MPIITLNQFKVLLPNAKAPQDWVDAFNDLLPKHFIQTKEQVAMFIAQTGHESTGYTAMSENLNYSADRLLVVFDKYFKTEDIANQYARQPQKVANLVYANRMGNGNESSGDGWKYRGRGIIGCTGKNNYTAFSMATYSNTRCVDDPDTVSRLPDALSVALWYWDVNKLKDVQSVEAATKIINKGQNGIADRRDRYVKALKVLS